MNKNDTIMVNKYNVAVRLHQFQGPFLSKGTEVY